MMCACPNTDGGLDTNYILRTCDTQLIRSRRPRHGQVRGRFAWILGAQFLALQHRRMDTGARPCSDLSLHSMYVRGIKPELDYERDENIEVRGMLKRDAEGEVSRLAVPAAVLARLVIGG